MTYEVIIETDGRRPDADAERKLRALLHRLQTTYGLRVVQIQTQENDRVRH